MNNTTLSCLTEGSSAVVTSVRTNGAMRRRLMDMGLIEGTKVICLYRRPHNDPAAYFIRGTVIALRKTNADEISVRIIS